MRAPTLICALTLFAAACGDSDDTAQDTSQDTSADTGADTGGGDITTDAGADAGGDTGADVATDVAGDTGGDVATDTPGDTQSGPTLAVTRAWSADGASVYVRFDRDVDASSAGSLSAWTVTAADSSVSSVTTVTVTDDTVQLDVSPALDPGSTYTVAVSGVAGSDGAALAADPTVVDVMGTAFLNMVWHQHQPSYLDPATDELQGPWVRKHAQKDYVDMTLILRDYPAIHFNVNLTSSLLQQLQMYIDRLGPFVDLDTDTIDEAAFLAAWARKTDPWVDALLNDTPDPASASAEELGRFYGDVWSTHSIAEPLRAYFPEYAALIAKNSASYTQLDLAHLKVWFELAWIDPDYLRGSVELYDDGTDNVFIDLSDVVDAQADGTFTLKPTYTDTTGGAAAALARVETLANRLVAENFKLAKASIEAHKELAWDGSTGQVEVLTTPFFHPILPLLVDTDLAREGQPADPLPNPAFAWPSDAELQIATAVEYYTQTFGMAPRGMWPSEGAVAEEILPAFVANDIDWIATDKDVLLKGLPGASHLLPYKVDEDTVAGDGGQTDDELMIVFRDTEISDKVGFFYQSNPPAENAADFVVEVLDAAPRWGEPRRLLSVILDGENAWEWYTMDHDAKQFLHLMYQGLSAEHALGSVITVTGSEYIDGNAARDVPANPVTDMTEYEDLFPGSWIGGRLDTWIGEVEENLAWSYLQAARSDFETARLLLEPVIGAPDSLLVEPTTGVADLAWWKAWRAMLSAEGSDWFWWYGSDQTAAGGDDSPFDDIFRAQITAMYGFANEALADQSMTLLEVPTLAPIIQPAPVGLTGPFGTVPTLDGALTPDESEWTPPGGVFFDNDTSGAQNDPTDDIGAVYYGYNKLQGGRIFLGVSAKEDLGAKLGTDYQIVVYTSHGELDDSGATPVINADPFNAMTKEGTTVAFTSGGPARRVAIDFSSGSAVATVENADGSGGWTAVASPTVNIGGPVSGGSLLELEFLLSDLGMTNDDPLEFVVLAVDGGTVVDTAPNGGAHIMFADPTKLVTVTFEVDVTGATIDLSTYISIADPPPPAGTGTVSIVGNRDEFGNWTPNSVFMKDDGVAPDATANDNIWTLAWAFVPGSDLQYKYTIGKQGDSWGGTEEYPLTNRGYTVPADGTKTVRIRDIFADRPDPSGSTAPNTVISLDE